MVIIKCDKIFGGMNEWNGLLSVVIDFIKIGCKKKLRILRKIWYNFYGIFIIMLS